MIRLRSLLSFGNSLDPTCKLYYLNPRPKANPFFQGTMSTLSSGPLSSSLLLWFAHASPQFGISSCASTLGHFSLRSAVAITNSQEQYRGIRTRGRDVQFIYQGALLSLNREIHQNLQRRRRKCHQKNPGYRCKGWRR